MSNDIYQPDEIPATLTKKIYVTYGIGTFIEGQITVSNYLSLSSHDEGFAKILLHEQMVTFKIPPCKVNLIEKKLEVLNAKKSEILSENHSRLKEIQDKIDKLLSIEFKPQAAPETEDMPF